MATEKQRWTDEIYNISLKLSQVMEKAPEIVGAYFDNGYNSGGADELVTGDISSVYNFTGAEVGDLVTLLQQFNNFHGNSAVTTGDYGATLNKIRFGKV